MSRFEGITYKGIDIEFEDMKAVENAAEPFSESKAYITGEYCTYEGTLYKFVADHEAGAWNAAQVEKTTIGDVLSDKDLFDDIPGTTQTVTFNANDQPVSVVHTSGNDTVRSDVFTWGDGTVTEVRTLADGRHVTYVTNLTTLVTTISEVEEAI